MTTSVRDILINLIGKETISPAAKKSERALDDLGDEMSEAARAAKSLDRQIGDVQKSLKQLAIASTSGEDVKKQIREQERALRDLNKRRKLLGDVDLGGGEAADKFALMFGARIGPLMARAPISPGLLAAAVPAGPLIANLISGAVVGGIGTGAVAAGIALAARDPAVQAEAKSLADEIGQTLTQAAQPFVPATIDAIDIARAEFRNLDGDLEEIFADAADYVEPLARGATGFVREMVPGIRDAVRAGQPFFTMLGEELPELGRDVGELFGTMADHADDGAEAVGTMLDLMGGLADATGVVVDTLSGAANIIDTIEKGTALGPAEPDRALLQMDRAARQAAAGIRDVRGAAGEATVEVELLSAAINRLSTENLDARAAVRSLEEAYDAASAAAKANGKTLDEGTEKGRANAAALDRIVTEAKAAQAAIIAQKGSQGEANEVMEKARKQFVEIAVSMGMDRVEAERLAAALLGIPSVKPTVKVDASSGKAAVEEFMKKYREVKNKSVTIQGYVRWTSSGLKVPGGTILEGFAGGGPITGPGPKGVDSKAILAAPGEHMLSADEVDAAGGHKAIEAWRKSLLSGGGAPPPAGPVARSTSGVSSGGVIPLRPDTSRIGQLGMVLIDILLPEVRRRGGLAATFREAG